MLKMLFRCGLNGHVPSFCLCFVVEMTVYRGKKGEVARIIQKKKGGPFGEALFLTTFYLLVFGG